MLDRTPVTGALRQIAMGLLINVMHEAVYANGEHPQDDMLQVAFDDLQLCPNWTWWNYGQKIDVTSRMKLFLVLADELADHVSQKFMTELMVMK